jgi:hypothetical protein
LKIGLIGAFIESFGISSTLPIKDSSFTIVYSFLGISFTSVTYMSM